MQVQVAEPFVCWTQQYCSNIPLNYFLRCGRSNGLFELFELLYQTGSIVVILIAQETVHFVGNSIHFRHIRGELKKEPGKSQGLNKPKQGLR